MDRNLSGGRGGLLVCAAVIVAAVAALIRLELPPPGAAPLRIGPPASATSPSRPAARPAPSAAVSARGSVPTTLPRPPASPKRGVEPEIRVALTDGPVPRVRLQISGPYVIRVPGKLQSPRTGADLAEGSLVATARGFRLGLDELPGERLEIEPQTSPAIWVDGHQYRGRLRLERVDGRVLAVNVLPVEDYVASVIDSEMPAEFSAEARRAQGVAARSFALYRRGQAPPEALVDVAASVRGQKYLGSRYRAADGRLLAGESPESRELAASTRGLVLTVGGRPFCTYYCAVCGGRTLLGSEVFPDTPSPLVSVPCAWCASAKNYSWEAVIARSELDDLARRIAREQGGRFGKLRGMKRLAVDAGRMPQYELRDETQALRVSGAQLRAGLASREVLSPNFEIAFQGESIRLRGTGHGHGVGLCQWGARGQAHAGRMWRDILSHYYPRAELSRVYD